MAVMEHLLTTVEVAERIGRDPATITRWVNAGRLTPTYRFPGRTGACLFDPTEVEALAATYKAAEGDQT